HQLAKAQRDAALVEQAAGEPSLEDAGIAGDGPKEQQRRRTAHDLVELGLDLRRERGVDRLNAGAGHGGSLSGAHGELAFPAALRAARDATNGVAGRRGAQAAAPSACSTCAHRCSISTFGTSTTS